MRTRVGSSRVSWRCWTRDDDGQIGTAHMAAAIPAAIVPAKKNAQRVAESRCAFEAEYTVIKAADSTVRGALRPSPTDNTPGHRSVLAKALVQRPSHKTAGVCNPQSVLCSGPDSLRGVHGLCQFAAVASRCLSIVDQSMRRPSAPHLKARTHQFVRERLETS